MRSKVLCWSALVCLMGATALTHSENPAGQLAHAQRLANGEWITYSGDLSGKHHSSLSQITPENVASLKPAWTFKTEVDGKMESAPLVLGGIIYITGPDN